MYISNACAWQLFLFWSRTNCKLWIDYKLLRRSPVATTNCKWKFFSIVPTIYCELWIVNQMPRRAGRLTVPGSHPCLRCAYTVSDARCHLKTEGERYSPHICKSSERRPSTIKQCIQQTGRAAVSVSFHIQIAARHPDE